MGRPPKGPGPSGDPEVPPGRHRVAHEARRGAARDSRAGPRGPSGGVRFGGAGRSSSHSGRPGGVRSPPGAASDAQPEPPPGRTGPGSASARSRLESRPPRDVPHPTIPGHSPRGRPAAAPAAAAVAGPAWRGLCLGSGPRRPAQGGGAGRRAEDEAGAPRQ